MKMMGNLGKQEEWKCKNQSEFWVLTGTQSSWELKTPGMGLWSCNGLMSRREETEGDWFNIWSTFDDEEEVDRDKESLVRQEEPIGPLMMSSLEKSRRSSIARKSPWLRSKTLVEDEEEEEEEEAIARAGAIQLNESGGGLWRGHEWMKWQILYWTQNQKHTILCMYVCTYVRTYVRMYVCMYVCMYLHTYVNVNVCMPCMPCISANSLNQMWWVM